MFRREKPDRAQRAARGGEVDGKQLENPAGEGKSSNTSGQQEEEEEEEEEEYPDNVECEDEYDEEDVYVLVELPASIDAETFSSAAAVTIKGMGTGTPLLKLGDEAFDGKAEPIIGTTLTFTTPPAGSSGREPVELACFSTMRINFNHPGARRPKRPKR